MNFFGGGRLMFSQMDQFQHWVVSKDVAWEKTIRFSSLMTLKLTPIRHLVVKEFLQSIVQLNVNAMKSMVQQVSVIIIENHVAKMLCLPQTRITKLPTMHFGEANLFLQMAPLSAFVQNEGRGVSQLKGKYATRLLALIQVIQLKGIQGMYVGKKFMFLVAWVELQNLINWAQMVFSNLHSRLWDFSTTIKLKIEDYGKDT